MFFLCVVFYFVFFVCVVSVCLIERDIERERESLRDRLGGRERG